MKQTLTNRVARWLVLLALALHLALLALQQLDLGPLWLAELSRFMPFYWLLPPLCAALLVSFWLGTLWRLLCVTNLLLFGLLTMDFHWQWDVPDAATGAHVRVLSYNIKAFYARHREGGIEAIEREVALYAPDIVALQDAQQWLTDRDERQPAPARPVFGLPYVMAFDQYVLASRFPLQDCRAGELTGQPQPSYFLQCQTDIAGRRVQLATLHFVSPRHSLLATRSASQEGLQQWQENLALRLEQSRRLAGSLAQSQIQNRSQGADPLIVMGDFNAPEDSPVVGQVKALGLRDAFAQGGSGWGYTHGHALSKKIDLFRIDHILVGADLLVQSADVGSSDASEHNLVVADLLLQPKGPGPGPAPGQSAGLRP